MHRLTCVSRLHPSDCLRRRLVPQTPSHKVQRRRDVERRTYSACRTCHDLNRVTLSRGQQTKSRITPFSMAAMVILYSHWFCRDQMPCQALIQQIKRCTRKQTLDRYYSCSLFLSCAEATMPVPPGETQTFGSATLSRPSNPLFLFFTSFSRSSMLSVSVSECLESTGRWQFSCTFPVWIRWW